MHDIAALVLIALFATYCIFVVSAIWGALTSRLELFAKVVWIAAIFALPFLGSVLWHLAGKKSALD
ncbi:hypothetical protein [Streptomyces sp. Ag109_O5-1]|uniref:hypothetical protein n=1 Tax=Streptomyces sp. Ag109_O5-1 TaxID=1938851 RepID=UPI000F4EB737|nr:hypothetical protein [Streptomyces sp. Ag109_O5-1]